jgi:hypothetical protein
MDNGILTLIFTFKIHSVSNNLKTRKRRGVQVSKLTKSLKINLNKKKHHGKHHGSNKSLLQINLTK